ncbi:FAD-dependent oxidoreductase [Polynucleobacter sp. UK-Mo-2m-Kol15]|uniref:FAD-dependent oxidoreductase n=1 Tax=Polynucleobacter sp. UK-Mo-2m-Kol15 TaxID=2576916 RepID=UPI001C0ACF97|nr:FAD-dependent oxidoreductase [Polynucleobacter sp. UK-Mo-2m-Kol15]MBU3576191.1 FAD-dependent oxidoreductase [Polynucleobacter sp. UK-Mo-2m-Kol15]
MTNPIEMRKIIPPAFEQTNLGEKILCYRPMKHGMPNLSIEQMGSKVIAHNYGHGGSGWTLGPGSAKYVNSLLIDSALGNALTDKSAPIAIIGAGLVGLFTAYDLVKRGYRNITIYAEKLDALASHYAGGLLAPVSMDNDHEMQAVIDQIGIDAYRFYDDVARNKNSDFKQGARLVPSYFNSREDSGLEAYVGKVMNPAKEVMLDFGNGTTRKMVVYDDGIFMNTALLMAELHDFINVHHINIVLGKIHAFDELEQKFIFNCSGLGAAELTKDKALVPVQGHLIMLKNQIPENMNYMILVYFGEGVTESGQKVKRSFYIFPKHLPDSAPQDIGVIGGTFIEGGNPDKPNLREYDSIIDEANAFFGIK